MLSEDVDTIMFGCTRTLRNWSAEGKGTRPTHVSMYDVEDLNMADLGLDREGMVLVALMSGGDYIPEGVPGCGPKVACEAAKAGYGKSLCQLRASDTDGLAQWKASLKHELQTNESKYFRTRHKALAIPEDFPNLEVLGYYTHPKVSPESTLEIVRQKLKETGQVQLEALREFARETFNWDFRIGAIKFIRVLSEGLFVHRLHQEGVDGDPFVKKISGRRNHFSTDATSELRLAYIPEEIVPIDISNEVEEEIAYSRSGLALNSDDEFAAAPDSVEDTQGGKIFDITKPTLTWVLEEVARRFAPRAVEAWEASSKSKSKSKSSTKKNASVSKTKKAGAMPHGALDSFVRVTKVVETQKEAGGSDAIDTNKAVSAPVELGEPEDVSLPPLRQPNRFRRPQTPPSPRQPSKQPTPSASPSQDGWTITSSPESTRRDDDAGVFEAIVISSSPTGDASPLSWSIPPSPTTAMPSNRGKEVPKSIRSILAAGATSRVRSEHDKPASSISKPTQKRPSFSKSSQAAGKLKQMSMDMFTQKQPRPETDRPTSSSKRSEDGTCKSYSSQEDLTAISIDSEADIFFSTASHSQPKSQLAETTKKTPSPPPPPPPQRERSPSPVPAKKLFIPSASRPGFFDEVEVDVDEYEERIAQESQRLQTRGVRSGVTRWSDVSFIDLTGHDNTTTK